MKLSIILLLISCLRVSANTYSQKLNLTLKNASYSQAFSAIEQKTRFRILYSDDLLPENTVTVEARNEPLTNVLNHILYGSNLTYKVLDNKVIVISRTDTKFQAKTISGMVTDTSGNPLSGVSVMVKGTTKGTMTNMQGMYNIDVPDNNVTLVFAYIGYATKEVAVNSTTVDITLVPLDAIAGSDIVVTALGIKRSEKSLSYSVQQIGGNEVNDVKTTSFVNALSGKVAGLTLTSAPGPGAPTKAVLRGNKSIAGNNNALYVIDGVPMMQPSSATSDGFTIKENPDFISNINPDDIESINVLTGASGAALYGMQGANGVILINTKKGVAGNTKISFSSQANYDNPFILPKRQTEYGSTTTNGAVDFNGWGSAVTSSPGYDPKEFFNTGSTYTNALTISGGSDKNQTLFSAAATNAKGILPNNKLNRYNFFYRNSSYFFDNKLSIDFSASYTYQKFQNMPSAGQYFNPLTSVYLFPNGLSFDSVKNYETFDRATQVYVQNWPYGDHSLSLQNPYWVMYRDMFYTTRNRIMGAVTARYNFTNWLYLQGRVSIDRTSDQNENDIYGSTLAFLASNKANGSYNVNQPVYSQTYADLLLNMNKKLNKFSLNATLGTSLVNSLTTNLGVSGGIGDYLVPNFFYLNNLDIASVNFTQQKDRTQTQSVFFSGELGYNDYLYLTATARNDWPSTLAYATKNSFFYPSVGLSAVISQMATLPQFISYAKARVSYAGVGNSLPIYVTNPTIALNSGGNFSPVGARPFTTLAPEHTNSLEAGIDLRFAHDKINFSATYYHTNTTNQFFSAPAPQSSGYTTFYYNAGNVRNQGLELTLGYNGTWGDFSWNPSVNFALNRSKVLQMLTYKDALGNAVSVDSLNLGGDPNIIVKKGQPFGEFSLYDFQRDAQGNIVKDKDGLPVYNSYSSIDKPLQANYTFGISNSFGYKNFSLSFLINARVGGYVYSKTQQVLDEYGLSVQSARNRNAGSQAYYQRISSTSQDGTAYLYSATNIRLQELSFGYSIPGKIFNNKIKKLQISFIARNLWMMKNNAPFDPEMTMLTGNSFQGTDYFSTPTLRSFGVSLNVGF